VVDSCSAILDDDGDIKLNPLKTVYIDGDLNISGTCTHNACSCDGCGGSSTGTGTQQQIAHGLVDENNDPVVPGECSAFCTGAGGTCSIDYCDDEYIYITCTNGITYKWKVRK